MSATSALSDAVRRVLAEDGRPPSRRRIEALIVAGAVTLDGRVLRDPAARVEPAARIAIDVDGALEELAGAPGAGVLRPAARPAPREGVLHADAQLVVADRGAFAPGGTPEAFAEAVAHALARGRPVVLHPVADPSSAGSGPVLLGASRTSAQRLAEAVLGGAVRETLLALRSAGLTGPGEVVLQSGEADGDGRRLAWALVQREDAPLGPPPVGARDLVRPHRAALTLKHPKTNRRLAFACDPSAAFSAACARLSCAPSSARDGPAGASDA